MTAGRGRPYFAVIIFGACVLLVSVGLTWGMGKTYVLQRRAAFAYRPVAGKVISVQIEQHYSSVRTTYSYFRPVIRYRYVINGHEYESSRYAYQYGSFHSSSEATQAAARFPVGSVVTVYYDPEDAGEAVLFPGAPKLAFPILFCALFIVTGLACVGYGVRGQKVEIPDQSSP